MEHYFSSGICLGISYSNLHNGQNVEEGFVNKCFTSKRKENIIDTVMVLFVTFSYI